MSMIANLDGSPHEMPQHGKFSFAMSAFERDERTISEFTDDPMQWVGLLGAVGNYLYHPDEPFFRQQLIGHFASIVNGIHEEYGSEGGTEELNSLTMLRRPEPRPTV